MGIQDNIRNPNPVSTYDWKEMRTIRKKRNIKGETDEKNTTACLARRHLGNRRNRPNTGLRRISAMR